mmetsp:Transcript_13208/g.26805  ORF Transcript_13208/g.26805 Transcript_13208/m.26805 type:complete len:99 (+) Transcript_13208:58-354(+)
MPKIEIEIEFRGTGCFQELGECLNFTVCRSGMPINNYPVHPRPGELLLASAGAPAARSDRVGLRKRCVDGWCWHAGGSRATSSSPQAMVLGSKSISVS